MSEFKRNMMEMLNNESSANSRYSYMAVEKLVLVMLADYIGKQNKEFISEPFAGDGRYRFDGLAPDGFDDYQGKTAIEIKFFRHPRISTSIIYDTIGRAIVHSNDIENLIFILLSPEPISSTNRIMEKITENQNFKIHIWDINDFEKIVNSNPKLYSETLANLNSIILRDTISNSVKESKIRVKNSKRNQYIRDLQREYTSDNVVLFLGAGASKDANIATWDDLISKLFVALINKVIEKENKRITKAESEKIVETLVKQEDRSPLLQARLLRRGLETDFEDLIRRILYKDAKTTSDLLKELAQLCVPNRGKIGIQAIVNYNFDDLVEKNLKKLRVKYHSIYAEGMIPNNDEVGIYHVHGFIPQDKGDYKNLAKSLLVFSEEGYHKLLLEPYNWANISQLNYLINNCCVFIGLSMTDPNLRRLLEVAAQKQRDGEQSCKHYAIMKKQKIDGSNDSEGLANFENVNASLQESLYEELGVNIIWIDEFSEIPEILKMIKDGTEDAGGTIA